MKIIGKSNYDYETVDDVLIAENVNVHYSKEILEHLNRFDNRPLFYVLVEDDYKLYEFTP